MAAVFRRHSHGFQARTARGKAMHLTGAVVLGGDSAAFVGATVSRIREAGDVRFIHTQQGFTSRETSTNRILTINAEFVVKNASHAYHQ